MKVSYLVQIEKPETHIVKVSLTAERPKGAKSLEAFLPSWSPGSYLMREYARHIRWVRATQENGEVLWVEQKAKGVWEIDWQRSQLKSEKQNFTLSYEIYLHELTVRTSHVDSTHAFLHGPSYLMGLRGGEAAPEIEFRFPPLFSKIATSLEALKNAPKERFVYTAPDYDTLIDCPVEIGCHDSDGFVSHGVPHALAFYGVTYPHGQNLKADMQKAVEEVIATFGDVPFTRYQFITHFAPKIGGGLEHLNSTALQFDGRRLSQRKDYLIFLSLVAHEYFHAWNVKRIRPKELGPFDYLSEGYTRMLWLAEGLTSFLDDLLVYRAGLSTLEEYLDFVKGNLDSYYATPGRRFHSLEDSSYNAWVKLYRPDENSKNSSVSYYLKGGLVFMALHALMLEQGKGIDDLLRALWADYKARPESGITKAGVLAIVRELAGEKTLAEFQRMLETTEEIDFDGVMKRLGCELSWQDGAAAWVGADFDFDGQRVLVRSVTLDSPAYKCGLNAGDELLALNGLRVLKEDVEKWGQMLKADTRYALTVSRLGLLTALELMPERGPRTIKEIKVVDPTLAEKAFKRR